MLEDVAEEDDEVRALDVSTPDSKDEVELVVSAAGATG